MSYKNKNNVIIKVDNQELRDEVTSQLAQTLKQGGVSVSDINKNLGKFDQTYMSDELLQQMAGNTPINAVPADESITTKKLAFAKKSKNLFNKATVTSGRYVDFGTGNLLSSGTFSASDFILVEPASYYTLSHPNQIAWYDTNKSYISGVSMGRVFTALSPANAAYVRLSIANENLSAAQFEKGLYKTKYESFEPKIDTATTDLEQLKQNIFDVPSKNLFNKDDIIIDRAIVDTTGQTYTSVGSFHSQKIKVEPNTDYAVNEQVSIAFFDANQNYISGFVKKGTFKTPANVEYLLFSSSATLKDTIQLEKGTVSTTFYPYGLKISAKQLDIDSLNINKGGSSVTTAVSKYPFDETATINTDENLKSKILSAIKGITLYGTTKTLKYRMRAFRRNDVSGDGNSYWVIEIADSNELRVAQWVATNYVEPTTLDKVYLTPLFNSGVSGHVWVDWSKLGTTSFKMLSQTFEQMGLDEQTYLSSDESKGYNGNIRNLNDYYWKAIKASAPKIRNLQGHDTLSFSVVTDSHIEKSTIPTQSSIEAISALAEYADVDFIAHLGDMIVGDLAKEESMQLLDLTMSLAKKHTKSPVLAIRGNHDRNDLYHYTDDQDRKNNLITNKEWYQAITRRSEQYGIVGDENNPYGGYFYKDFNRQKIRAVFLNTCEMLETDGVPNLPEYATDSVESFNQLKWLSDSALNLAAKDDSNEWAIVVFSHIPSVATEANHNYGTLSPNFTQLITAYKDGLSGSITVDAQTIPYDYTSQGAREFIGHFYGHVHEDIHIQADGVNHFISNSTMPSKRWSTSLERESYGEKTLSANTVVINRSTRTVDVVKTGIGTDHQFTW